MGVVKRGVEKRIIRIDRSRRMVLIILFIQNAFVFLRSVALGVAAEELK